MLGRGVAGEQPPQAEEEVVALALDLGHRPELVHAQATPVDGDRPQLAVELDVLDQHAPAHGSAHLADVDAPALRGAVVVGPAGEAPHGLLEDGGPSAEGRRDRTGQRGLADLGVDRPQVGQLGGHEGVVGRAHGGSTEGAGPPPLGPAEHLGRAPVVERQAGAEPSQLRTVAGGAGAQLGRAEAGAVAVDHAEPVGERPTGAGPVALGQRQQRGGVPGLRPQLGRAAPSSGGRVGQLGPGHGRTTESEGQTADEGAHVHGLDPPSLAVELDGQLAAASEQLGAAVRRPGRPGSRPASRGSGPARPMAGAWSTRSGGPRRSASAAASA